MVEQIHEIILNDCRVKVCGLVAMLGVSDERVDLLEGEWGV